MMLPLLLIPSRVAAIDPFFEAVVAKQSWPGPGGDVVLVKGAAEILLRRCEFVHL